MSEYIHGTAIIWKETGILLLGESGCGKSSLAAELIQLGASLIADDQVRLLKDGDRLYAEAPEALAGVLELRDLALITLPYIARHALHLMVSLTTHDSRLTTHEWLQTIPAITLPPYRNDNAAKLALYAEALQEGRVLPEDWKPSA
ncbi:MAG: HPr kinase/phosphorylase [Rickettsiales bacterium]